MRLHEGHKVERCKKEIADGAHGEHRKCGSCGGFIEGKVISGIRCHTCKSWYHKICFER